MRPITKIYVDSRYRTADSASSSDFKVELPETISLPRDTKAYITDITIPNTMTTVMKDFNDTFYTAEISQRPMTLIKDIALLKITLTPGNYTAPTLAAELQTKLNAYLPLERLHYSIIGDSVNNTLTLSKPGHLTNEAFRLLSDHELRHGYFHYDSGPDRARPKRF